MDLIQLRHLKCIFLFDVFILKPQPQNIQTVVFCVICCFISSIGKSLQLDLESQRRLWTKKKCFLLNLIITRL